MVVDMTLLHASLPHELYDEPYGRVRCEGFFEFFAPFLFSPCQPAAATDANASSK